MARVSVIVPVYNAGRFLRECVDSIRAQSFRDIEVICVDDASTDGSGEELRALEGEDGRVRALSLDKCLGVSAARNAGLDAATGEYVLFVDADDAIDPRLVERAVARADACGAQMTIFGFYEWHSTTGALVPREMCEELRDRGTFRLGDLSGPSTALVTPNVWRILFRRDFLEGHGLRFHEDLLTSEDLAFIYEALLSATSITLLDERLYRYRRDGGTTLTRAPRGDAGYRALRHVFDYGEREGLIDDASLRHLVNLVLDVAEYAMGSAACAEEFDLLFRGFRDDWLGLALEHRDDIAERYLPFLEGMIADDELGYLFALYDRARSGMELERAGRSSLEADLASSRGEVAAVRGSRSYRLGHALLFLPSLVKRALGSR